MARVEPVETQTVEKDADAAALVDFVRQRDVLCPLCRYNLRGLTVPRCPECGRELRLSIGLVEPRQGAWLMCQIALTAVAGIGVLAWITVMQHGWPGGSQHTVIFDACFLSFLASPALAAAVFFLRRGYLRMQSATQWGFAIAACVLAVLCVGGMFASEM